MKIALWLTPNELEAVLDAFEGAKANVDAAESAYQKALSALRAFNAPALARLKSQTEAPR